MASSSLLYGVANQSSLNAQLMSRLYSTDVLSVPEYKTDKIGVVFMLNSQLSANDKAGFWVMVQESKVVKQLLDVSKVETAIHKTSNVKEDDEIVVKPKEVTKTVKPSFEKIESVNARNETVRQAENSRKNNKGPRGNKRNWNGMITQKLEYQGYTARPKAEVNTVKASTSWVWKPKHEELDHVFKSNSGSKTLIRYDYVNALEKLKLLCVTRVNFGLLNCHSEVAVWIPLKLLLLKIMLEGVSDKQGFGVQDTAETYGSLYDFNAASFDRYRIMKHLGSRLELAIPGQTATGKESSNPFMAGSLPKTIHFCDSLQSDEDSFELIELMILCTNFLTMVRDLENLKTTYLIMKKVWVRMHPNRGGLMMQMQRLPSLMRLQMMLETRTTRFQTTIRSEEVFGYILLVIKKLTLKKLDD
ncbi:hypothetical protein Tco_1547937 [Tanacetum coccineum]